MIDATAAVELVLMTEKGMRVADRLFGIEEKVHAPELLDLEVAQVLRKLNIRGSIDANQANRAFADFLNLTIKRHSHEQLRSRIWQLRENISAYDAAYVALAEFLGAPLITFDERLMRSAAKLVNMESI